MEAWVDTSSNVALASPEVQIQLTGTGEIQESPPISGLPATVVSRNGSLLCGQLLNGLLERCRINQGDGRFCSRKQLRNRENLNFRVLAVWGFKVSSLNRFGLHRFGWLSQRDEQSYFRILPVNDMSQIPDHRHANRVPAFY